MLINNRQVIQKSCIDRWFLGRLLATILQFSKYFLGFHINFWIANYFLIREKFICGSNNFLGFVIVF